MRSARSGSNSQRDSKYIYTFPTKTDPESIVRAILSGVDIIFVDPLLFQYILPQIEKMKSKYTYLNEEDLVKQLEFFETYIENSRRQTPVIETPKSTQRSVKAKKRNFTDEELENEIENILATDHVGKYTAEQAAELIEGMKHRRQMYIEQTNYLAADRAELYVQKLLQITQLNSVREIQQKSDDKSSMQIKKAEADLKEAKQKWEKVYSALRDSAAREFQEMEEKHNNDLAELEALREQPPPLSIAKYSNYLLDLRQRQEYLIKIRNFSDAAVLKDQADILQASENRDFIKKWNQQIDQRIEQCNTTYTRNIASRRLYWKREETQLIQDAEKEVAKAEKAIEIMKNTLRNVRIQKRRTTSELTSTRQNFIRTPGINERQTPHQHLQKQILNKKLYTATPRR